MSATIFNETEDVNFTAPSGLMLYYHQYSFYSQKVLMALHEKQLPFESHIVDLSRGTQYDPWFLALNPRGEVPVLIDNGKVIPDSGRIVDYLDDNFCGDEIPALIPMKQGPEMRQKVTHFRYKIDQIPAGVITMGSVFHPDLVENPKLPFIAPIRKLLAKAELNSNKILRQTAEENPSHKNVLLKKAELLEKKHFNIMDKDEFVKTLDRVEKIFDIIENELASHIEDKIDWWLCTDQFTAADISLTILLERLNQLGFESRFWARGKRPSIAHYYERARLRKSFQLTVPTKFDNLRAIASKHGQNPLVVFFTAIAVVLGGVIMFRKFVGTNATAEKQ